LVDSALIGFDFLSQVEAKGNKPNGIGVVKLMGRSSGYIAAYSTIGSDTSLYQYFKRSMPG